MISKINSQLKFPLSLSHYEVIATGILKGSLFFLVIDYYLF